MSNQLKQFNLLNFIYSLFIVIDGFILTRHAQYKFLSPYLAPMTCFIVLLGCKFTRELKILTPILIFCTCSVFGSVLFGNFLDDSLRFFIIIIFTLLAFYCITPNISNKYLLLIPFIIQAVCIVFLSLYLTFSQDESLARELRSYFLDNNIGDVYSFNGYYYKVQIIGNALIPLVFYIALANFEYKLYKFIAILMALAIVICGNLNYIIIGFIATIIFFYKDIKYKKSTVITITLLFIIYIYDNIYEKFFLLDGSQSSMDSRFIQLNIIYSELIKSPINFLFGYGLGARLPGEYSSNLYIELQSFYIIYQIGLIGALIYLLTLLILILKFLTRAGIIVFILYISSSFMNPYIFDSNHILATILICIFFSKSNKFYLYEKSSHFHLL